MVKEMLGVTEIGEMLDVEPKTVSIWRQRYADFPEPDVRVHGTAGWDPRRIDEIRAWMARRPGRGRKPVSAEHMEEVPTEHTQEALRRIFVFRFMRPDDFAWAPVSFPGVQYDEDGLLRDGMQAKATQHLLQVITDNGYALVFDDPERDPATVLHHILWDRWTSDEADQGQFIGRLFNERGQIYQGCTAFDAARYTLQRLATAGGRMCWIHQA